MSSLKKPASCLLSAKPLLFRSMFKNDEKHTSFLAKQMYVFKMILGTRRIQCRQLGRENSGQKLINLRSMSQNDVRKLFLTKKISPQTGEIDKQKAILTFRTTKVSRNDKKHSLNAR